MNKLKEPLTFSYIFGVLEPSITEPIVLYNSTSIKNILDNFPIKYSENLEELEWCIDECCNGWFIKENSKNEYIRAHVGCDDNCTKEIEESIWENYLHLKIPTYYRNANEVLEFLLYDKDKSWLLRVIPKDVNRLFNMPCSLHIDLYSKDIVE